MEKRSQLQIFITTGILVVLTVIAFFLGLLYSHLSFTPFIKNALGATEILLTAATVVLTGVAMLVAIFALIGYNDIKKRALEHASNEVKILLDERLVKELETRIPPIVKREIAEAPWKYGETEEPEQYSGAVAEDEGGDDDENST